MNADERANKEKMDKIIEFFKNSDITLELYEGSTTKVHAVDSLVEFSIDIDLNMSVDICLHSKATHEDVAKIETLCDTMLDVLENLSHALYRLRRLGI